MKLQNIPGYFIEQKVRIPQYWHIDICLEAFKVLDTKELYNFFNCNNKLSFSRLMSNIFPNKPQGMSCQDYVNTLVEINTLEQHKSSCKSMSTYHKNSETFNLPETYPIRKVYADHRLE